MMVTVARLLVLVSQVNFQNYSSLESFRSPVAFWLCSADNTPWLALSKPLSPPFVCCVVVGAAIGSSIKPTNHTLLYFSISTYQGTLAP